MATLTSVNIDAVWRNVMSEFSSLWEFIPISSAQLRQLIVLIDAETETAEASIISALPPGDGKDWLVGNQAIGRGIMLDVMSKRKEVL